MFRCTNYFLPGKTTTVLALARALYGPDLYKSRILELNASDERGISVVREKIKGFAQHSVGNQKAKYVPSGVLSGTQYFSLISVLLLQRIPVPPIQTDCPGRGRHHDPGRPVGPATHHGGVLQSDAVLLDLQLRDKTD